MQLSSPVRQKFCLADISSTRLTKPTHAIVNVSNQPTYHHMHYKTVNCEQLIKTDLHSAEMSHYYQQLLAYYICQKSK